jgi:hypothetical protein
VAIDARFRFEHAACNCETYFRFRSLQQNEYAMRIKHDLPTYNASINLRTECSERKRRRGPNKKKIPKFMIQAANSVRIAIDAGNFDASMLHCLHRIP